MSEAIVDQGASCCAILSDAALLESSVTAGSAWPLYMQLLSLGTIMILGHCSGMCGPLMLSFRFGLQRDAHNKLQSIKYATQELLSYQFGKMCLYLIAGACAGALGSSLLWIQNWAAYLSITFAVLILIHALSYWLPIHLAIPLPDKLRTSFTTFVQAMQRNSSKQRQQHPIRGSFLLGLSMALLPCMLPFWVLSLAASSASAIHGAGLMALLVALNTPVLLAFACAPHLIKCNKQKNINIPPLALCCSAIWMLLIGLGALNIISHVSFELGKTHVVLW